MTTSRPYRVHLLPGLRDRLDALLGTVDACGAMVQLYAVLPRLHDRRPRTVARSDDGEALVYLGRFGWVNVGFSYIEVDETLLVICLWPDLLWQEKRTHEVECVLDNQAVEFLATYTEGGLL